MSRCAVRFRQAWRRAAERAFDRGIRLAWRVERRLVRACGLTHRGVQALAFTRDGKLILLELRYLPGWHLPGGRRRRREPAEAALLRELREELGEITHGTVTHLATISEVSRGIACEIELFRVDDCVLPARHLRNSEVRGARAWPVAALPGNAEVARARLALATPGTG
ncbi:MAG TPA: NUDIX domain-containing protein, partial [Novosphingobium sp.]